MTRKLSILLLIVTLLAIVLSLTSCAGVDALYKLLPAENSSGIAKAAHDLADWISDQFDAFLKFEWATNAWNWIDTTFGISEKLNQTTSGFDLIKTGNFMNILSGIGKILTSGIILLVFGVIAIAIIAVAILIDFITEILLIVLSVILMVAVLVLAILGFIYVLIPVF